MIKAAVLIPTRDNEGKPFSRRDWLFVEDAFIALCGGFSRETGRFGGWAHEGRLYREPQVRYIAILASWRQVPSWLELAERIRVRFRQIEISIEVAGLPENLGPPEAHQKA